MTSDEDRSSIKDKDLDDTLSEVAGQFFDVAVNPIAGMFCTLLSLQVRKGHTTKDEAKGVIASALDLINCSDHSDDVLASGHAMLVRMVGAIDRLPSHSSSNGEIEP
jgi:hypothetical protein